jgi:hypothetical protein
MPFISNICEVLYIFTLAIFVVVLSCLEDEEFFDEDFF